MEEMTNINTYNVFLKVVLWEKEGKRDEKGDLGEPFQSGQARPNEKGSVHRVVRETTQEAAERSTHEQQVIQRAEAAVEKLVHWEH